MSAIQGLVGTSGVGNSVRPSVLTLKHDKRSQDVDSAVLGNAQGKFLKTATEGWAATDANAAQSQPGQKRQLDKYFSPFRAGMKSGRKKHKENFIGKVGGVQHMIALAQRNTHQQMGMYNPWNVNVGDDGGIMTGLHRKAWETVKPIRKKRLKLLDSAYF